MQDMTRFRKLFVQRLLRIANLGSVGVAVTATLTCSEQSEHVDTTADPHGSGGADATDTGAGATGGSGGTFSFDASAGTGGASGRIGKTPVYCDAATPGDVGDPRETSADALRGQVVCQPLETAADVEVCPSPCEIVGRCTALSSAIADVYSGPQRIGGECCYDVELIPYPCYVGRTFFFDEGVVTAELRPGSSWRSEHLPDVSGLDARTRRALGEAWARDGLFEHASVASFARFAMQMLAVGAPAPLLRDINAASIDEVHHAEMCLALAAAYFGESLEPTPLPFSGPMTISTSLVEIVAETVMEGCIGETVATLQALDALEKASDAAVRAVLEKTVADESRHAELAWRFVAWALSVGGPDVQRSAARAFAAFRPPAPRSEDLTGVDLEAYEAHGRQTAVRARALAEQALGDVVLPCATALLARCGPKMPATGTEKLTGPAFI